MNLRRSKLSSSALVAILVASASIIAASGCQRGEPLGPVANANEVSRLRAAMSSGSGGGAATQAAKTGTGWATLKGRFIFDGTPVQMEPYNVNKDQAVCMPGGNAPLQESLIVDSSTKGIKNVAIYLRKASRLHESVETPESDMVVFDQEKCVFLSHVLPLTIGQTMEIKNSDSVGHNTNISGKNVFNQTVVAGDSLTFAPRSEEAVPRAVSCSIHPWMIAYLLPRKNGYYAITGADGSFEIKNLPAGETLELQVWHERGTGNDGVLVLGTDQAKKLKWTSKGRFKIELTEGEERDLDKIVVPGSALGS